MVEAAGVEPASESTSSQDSTCVSPLEFSPAASKRGEKKRQASLGKSRSHAPRRHVTTSPLNDIRPPTRGRGQGGRRG